MNNNLLASAQMIVATDLDGTLLDHNTYSWEAAKPSLELLQKLQIPVVFNTSKTIEEVIRLQKKMDICQPFIVENGSALVFPSAFSDFGTQDLADEGNCRIKVFGQPREQIISFLQKIRTEFSWRFHGFADWNIDQLIAHTGLDEESASYALQRRYSEPILWQDQESTYQDFCRQVHAHGLKILRGGRFVHILGETDKSKPLTWLRSKYESQFGSSYSIVALGDSPNDIDMLNLADIAVAVRSPSREFPQFDHDNNTIFTQGYGPVGWNEAITQILEDRKCA